MDFTQLAIWGVLVFAVIGLLFGTALAATARKFHVPSNPVADEVRGSLPAANCGACGYAGCGAYADAVVEEREVSPNLCTPGGKDVAERVASLTGKVAGEIAECVAALRCYGIEGNAFLQAEYVGIKTCAAADLVFGGPKVCKNGCLGLGDCVHACPFDAIHIGALGIAEVDYEKCTGCAQCIAVCPKKTLEIIPRDFRVYIACKIMNEKASVVRNACSVGCTICRRCVKACPAAAAEWTGSSIFIHHDKCMAYGPGCNEACVAVCPTHIFHRRGEVPSPELPKALKEPKAPKELKEPAAAEGSSAETNA
jgi:electron transport complex protein RnfB